MLQWLRDVYVGWKPDSSDQDEPLARSMPTSKGRPIGALNEATKSDKKKTERALNEANTNHSLGSTWYHDEDEEGAAVDCPSGKGLRLVMLTGITEEFGMIDVNGQAVFHPSTMPSLMLFQARKNTGDYHQNMDNDMFCRWLEHYVLPSARAQNIQLIPVFDNASYHMSPAPGSINLKFIKTKREMELIMKAHDIAYRPGRASKVPGAGGDNLEQMKEKAKA